VSRSAISAKKLKCHRGLLTFVTTLGLVLLAVPASAQSASARRPAQPQQNAISGQVIDAGSGMPLRSAQVHIEPVAATPARSANGGAEAVVRATRSVLTGSDGGYSFANLRSGAYRIHVQSAGYRRTSVDVDLSGGGEVRITVGLELSPVQLPAIEVVGAPVQSFPTPLPSSPINLGLRRTIALGRQSDFLGTDVRTLTAGDVQQAITLAEPDIFRALQRLPGVGRRDDYTAVLWTRGAPWAHTRVYFDGLPLYNPTHGGWLFSSINPDGIGSAHFQPGVRSGSLGEGAAGVLDLRSRSGTPRSGVNGTAELSLASARLGLDGELPAGIRWMFAARRTYVDLVTRAWEVLGGVDEAYVPYDFADLIGRVDVPLFFGATLEASGTTESDRLRGDVPDILVGNRAHWGNRAGRVTLRLPVGGARFSATAGGTRFRTSVTEQEFYSASDPDATTLSSLESIIEHDRTSFMLESSPRVDNTSWSIGLELIRDSLSYVGPFVLTGEGIPGIDLEPTLYTVQDEQNYRALWGELRLSPLPAVELLGSLRVEDGDQVMNLEKTRFSPSLSVRWQPLPSLYVSTGWGRSIQYTQAIGAAAGPLGPQLHIGNLWILANDLSPAIRADIATLGAEGWLGESWLFSANTYFRKASGVADPDPVPGPLAPRRELVIAKNVARGIELSARKLGGRWAASAGYGYGVSTMEADGLRYPSSADIRHTADLTGTFRIVDGLRIGGAFSFASGVPYTRIIVDNPPELLEPAAQRTPRYASLDLELDYTTRFGAWDVGAYVQLLNTLGRANAVTYAGTTRSCPALVIIEPSSTCASLHDEFDSGIPRLPLLGVRIGF
jgi:hypothetical protein